MCSRYLSKSNCISPASQHLHNHVSEFEVPLTVPVTSKHRCYFSEIQQALTEMGITNLLSYLWTCQSHHTVSVPSKHIPFSVSFRSRCLIYLSACQLPLCHFSAVSQLFLGVSAIFHPLTSVFHWLVVQFSAFYSFICPQLRWWPQR